MNIFGNIKTKLLSIEASPEKISRGYALGVFLGTTPIIGTKVIIALGLTSFLKWSRVASVIGVYHINILTGPLFYSVSFFVGKWLIGAQANLIIPRQMNSEAIFTAFLLKLNRNQNNETI